MKRYLDLGKLFKIPDKRVIELIDKAIKFKSKEDTMEDVAFKILQIKCSKKENQLLCVVLGRMIERNNYLSFVKGFP